MPSVEKQLLVAIVAYIRAAERAINAANRRAQFDAGSRGYARAHQAYEKADAEYGAAKQKLQTIVNALL